MTVTFNYRYNAEATQIREIIQDAQKFSRHAKRVRLTPDDVNAALRKYLKPEQLVIAFGGDFGN